jgi:hypothetical protein
MSDREQDLLSRVGALDQALRKCLEELTAQYGSNAKTKLRMIRDQLILKFKQSDIPSNRELDHATGYRGNRSRVRGFRLSWRMTSRCFPPALDRRGNDVMLYRRDANEQALAFVYCEDDPGRTAKLLTR